MSKRSSLKKMTRAAIILKYMRESRGLSQPEAGQKVGVTGSFISHLERGRCDASSMRIRTMVHAYEFTMDDFMEFIEGKDIPLNYQNECVALVENMKEDQLRAIYGFLVKMVS